MDKNNMYNTFMAILFCCANAREVPQQEESRTNLNVRIEQQVQMQEIKQPRQSNDQKKTMAPRDSKAVHAIPAAIDNDLEVTCQRTHYDHSGEEEHNYHEHSDYYSYRKCYDLMRSAK